MVIRLWCLDDDMIVMIAFFTLFRDSDVLVS